MSFFILRKILYLTTKPTAMEMERPCLISNSITYFLKEIKRLLPHRSESRCGFFALLCCCLYKTVLLVALEPAFSNADNQKFELISKWIFHMLCF